MAEMFGQKAQVKLKSGCIIMSGRRHGHGSKFLDPTRPN